MPRCYAGFKTFHTDDQQTLIRLGQSPSRILVAAVHWYNPAKHDFDDFLSWRTDLFKTMLINCAANIHRLDLDRVEAAMLNALIVIATGACLCDTAPAYMTFDIFLHI